MSISDPVAFLADPESKPEDLLIVSGKGLGALVKAFLGAIEQPDRRAKNRAVKLLAGLSAANPGALHPHRERFIELLESKDNIVLWNALVVVGHLAAADEDGRIAALAPRLRRFFNADSMITTGHAIEALGRIAAHSDKHRAKIVNWLVGVGDTPHGDECREILAGKALGALADVVGRLRSKAKVRAFAESYVESSRSGVAKKAGKLLKALG